MTVGFRKVHVWCGLLLSLTACAGSVSPGGSGRSSSLPPVRSLGIPEATTLLAMNSTPSIRVLSTGRVLATDVLSRRMITIAPGLTKIDTVFDATSAPPLTYPPGFAQLVPARADTTLFFDQPARGFRVIDPSGRVVRRLPIADQALVRGLQSPYGGSVIDPLGRLVVATQRAYFDRPIPGLQPQAESLTVARIALDRMGWDSLTAVMGTGQRTFVADSSTKPPRLSIMVSVVDKGDAWAVTSSGTIAVIRSGDFHVDWIHPDGSRRGSPPIPWAWTKFSAAQRDSLRSARQALFGSSSIRSVTSSGTISVRRPTQAVDTVPERMPAFAPSSARADFEGRIWLELGPRVVAGPPTPVPVVVGIIDSTGRIVERVELPARRTIVGFDRDGYVYAVVSTRTGEGFALERYRYRYPRR